MSYSEALGSARGLHSLGPSECGSDAGDLHPASIDEEGGIPRKGHQAQSKLHGAQLGGDALHEAASSRCASHVQQRAGTAKPTWS